MTVSTVVPASASNGTRSTTFTFLHRWAAWIAAGITVTAYVLLRFHTIHDPAILVGTLVVLAVVVSEQLIEAKRDLLDSWMSTRRELLAITGLTTADVAAIRNQVDQLGRVVASVSDDVSPKMLGFKDCVDDLGHLLAGARPGATVLMKHLAIDMNIAWDYVFPLLERDGSRWHVQYQLLILTSEPAGLAGGEDFLGWCRAAGMSLKRIEADLAEVRDRWQREGRQFSLEVREYRAIPFVHGIHLDLPDDMDTYYIGLCRWTGDTYKRFEWGEPYYRRVSGRPETPAAHDYARVFQGHFGHYWQELTTAKLLFHVPKTQDTREQKSTA